MRALYLVVISNNHGDLAYELSMSRNAVLHCRKHKEAAQVQVYDKNGWLLSMAERNWYGRVFRPRMFLDGEPKAFFKGKYDELRTAYVEAPERPELTA